MFRSIVTLVLFVWMFCHTQGEDEKLYKCSAWGDPHVTRFPSDENDQPQEVWCQETGWQTLLKNPYVHLSTKVSEKPYVISEFNLVISDDDGNTLCALTQDMFSSSPPDCGEDVKVIIRENVMTIQYKKNDIFIDIQKLDYNQQNIHSIYNLFISQSSYLIDKSTGVCKTSCDPNTGKIPHHRRQRRASNSDQESIKKSAENICETLISKVVPEFKISSLKRMDSNTRNSYSACVTDLKLTGDLTFAKASLQALTVNKILDGLTTKSDFEEISKKIIGRVGETNKIVEQQIPNIIKPSSPSSPSSKDFTVMYAEYDETAISCRETWAGEVKIVSAVYQAGPPSCWVDVTRFVKELCANQKRFCRFSVSRSSFATHPCETAEKHLKVIYRCQ